MILGCLWWAEIGRTVKPRHGPRLRAHIEGCPECQGALDQVERAAAVIRTRRLSWWDADGREQARTRLTAAIGRAATLPRRPHRLWARAAVLLAASLGGATVLAAVGTRVMDVWRAPPADPAPAPPIRAPARPRPLRAPPPAPIPAVVRIETPPPARPAPPPARPRPRPARPLEVRVAAAEPPRTASAAERAFEEGWDALRSGDHLRAAAQMERALVLGSPLSEDARYWRAVALGRAGVAGEARPAMEEFLRLHPESRRAGEVSAMLGWLLVDAGDLARARGLFRAATRDGSPRILESARAGLRAVGDP